ncbi:beta-ribofuranosylaminobenzene 5'-phosphate synthase [Caballeronia sp. SEWSISQ10-4 2]|uniref:beta-ribofuranosylaminobenzene 5'-phosphate synthase family protein n=1 Tax=Caballeronia sp. SEWSISQ10-4 2 TaxID=2937438 RepID=UPI00264ED3F2|nr:beta-ribofuranosylaminobenzene 5'-phosphate synthase family protein [Caballeronia sp. SEWSISQ10-4 2]MDN7183309.1 beta-ribofuranosylaminobenzene 5'-phosphate synthase [Caballeronia sp. SEWSISQ10-4 2]
MQLRLDNQPDSLSPLSAVTVDAPARLHLGFLDPSASLGRAFGSVGLTIDTFGTRITAQRADETQILGAHTEAQRARIAQYLDVLHGAYGGPPVVIEVQQAPRAHAGLGSGTQLALAVGTAFVSLLGRSPPTADLARLLGRGARSGIGLLGFDHGGLIVDSGRGGSGSNGAGNQPRIPSILTRQPFPEAWRILLVDDTRREGLHGDEERRALATLAPFPQTLAAHLCHLVLMLVLPGIAEHDFDAFAKGIGELQQTIGEYFAPVQGGVFSSPAVAAALDAAAAATQHRAGIGQTSWGPTGFAFLRGIQDAERALAAARDATRGTPGIVCSVAAGINRGAAIHAVGLQRCNSDCP